MPCSDRLWDVWVLVRVPFLGAHEQEVRDEIDNSVGLAVLTKELGKEFRIARIEPSVSRSTRGRRDALRFDPVQVARTRAMHGFLDERPEQDAEDRVATFFRPHAMDAVLEDLSDG